jgi:CMP-N,N'-diacetyllegionaminic acid synthase
MRRVLGLIPARGGSKGIPNKNMRLLGGIPLVGYAINAGKESSLITDLVVSSDDENILDFARKQGCISLKRSNENSDSVATIDAVVTEVLKVMDKDYDYILVLQPTAPLRTGIDVDKAIEMLENSRADSIVSVIRLDDIHPARMYTKRSIDNMLHSYIPEMERSRRQDLPDTFLRNGCIYAVKTPAFFEKSKAYPKG